mmetsp:Transcript_61507/g.199052  ORF Transcript_61507/g.199052 Transcript_61507/m.199052 type:complete len:88 (-) Transcript_61507:83-346(-)
MRPTLGSFNQAQAPFPGPSAGGGGYGGCGGDAGSRADSSSPPQAGRGGQLPVAPGDGKLEPWWCVRRVGPDGRPTVTPQAPQMSQPS